MPSLCTISRAHLLSCGMRGDDSCKITCHFYTQAITSGLFNDLNPPQNPLHQKSTPINFPLSEDSSRKDKPRELGKKRDLGPPLSSLIPLLTGGGCSSLEQRLPRDLKSLEPGPGRNDNAVIIPVHFRAIQPVSWCLQAGRPGMQII